MVKQFIKNEEEDLSDFEVDNQEDMGEMEVNIINEEEALLNHQKRIREDFHKIMKTKDVPWIETMDLVSDSAVDKNLNVDDDVRRELIFYNITLSNAVKGIIKLKENGEKLNRPGDFFAEMIKGDNQMQKIKKQIVTEQQRIKKYEEKKNKLQNVKFSKAMKDNQSKVKADFKRKTKEGVEAWKQRKKNISNQNLHF
jgi:rRNA-processing protein EBP2